MIEGFTPTVYTAFLTLTMLRLAKDFQKSPVESFMFGFLINIKVKERRLQQEIISRWKTFLAQPPERSVRF